MKLKIADKNLIFILFHFLNYLIYKRRYGVCPERVMRREGGREAAVDESSTEGNRRVDDSLINGSLSLFSMYAASQGVCLPGVKIPEMSMGAREAR